MELDSGVVDDLGRSPAEIVVDVVRTGVDAVLADVTPAPATGVERIHQALAALPAQQREMIVLARCRHRTAAEIAQDLQLPVATVYAQLRLGLHALATVLTV